MDLNKEGKNIGFAAVFICETVHQALTIEASINTVEMSALEIAMKII